LIAGGSIMGIVFAFMQGWAPALFKMLNIGPSFNLGEAQGVWGDIIAAFMFAFMALTLYRTGKGKISSV